MSADLIISVDTLSLHDLGTVYTNQKDTFTKTPIINVDFHNENVNYGALNLVDPGASSTTELVAELLASLGVKLTADIGTNLLNAIYSATNNFQHANTTSMAFEVASVCLKAGAKRFGVEAPREVAAPVEAVAPRPEPVAAPKAEPVAEPRIFVNKQPITPQPAQPASPLAQEAAEDSKKSSNPPSDWLKPKIFKSSGSLL